MILTIRGIRVEPPSTDLVNLRLVDLYITEDFLDRLESDAEEVLVEFLERAQVREV
jgi:hypothetical protein